MKFILVVLFLFVAMPRANAQSYEDRVNPVVHIGVNPPTFLVSTMLMRSSSFGYFGALGTYEKSLIDRDTWSQIFEEEMGMVTSGATSANRFEEARHQHVLTGFNVRKTKAGLDQSEAAMEQYKLYLVMNSGGPVDFVNFYHALEIQFENQCESQRIDVEIAKENVRNTKLLLERAEQMLPKRAISEINYLKRKLAYLEAETELPMRQEMVRTCYDGVPSWQYVTSIHSN